MLRDRNQWLFLIFCVYVFVILVFAGIYYLLYRKRPRTFAFNADILKKQSLDFKASTEEAIESVVKEVAYFRHLLEELNSNQDLIVPTRVLTSRVDDIATAQYRFTFFAEGGGSPHAPSPPIPYVAVFDMTDKQIAKRRIRAIPSEPEGIFEQMNLLISELEIGLAEDRRRLESLSSDWPEVWTFWDFLYFSTITQTTVGYGDMLPNSTAVRVLVTLQVIVGLLIIGILINFVFLDSSGSTLGPTPVQ